MKFKQIMKVGLSPLAEAAKICCLYLLTIGQSQPEDSGHAKTAIELKQLVPVAETYFLNTIFIVGVR